MRARRSVGVAAFATLLGGHTALAQPCPAMEPGDTVATIDSGERLAYLARAFDREISEVDAWSWSWGGLYAAGTVVQGVALVPTTDPNKRVGLILGTASTGFGALTLTLLPLRITLPLRSARRRWNDADVCATLANAERTMVSVEKDEALATGILPHLGNVAVNLGIALILGLGYRQWESAAISGGVGVAIGEANAFTEPHHLRDVLERYRSGRFDLGSPRLTWAIAPVHTADMTGAVVRVRW